MGFRSGKQIELIRKASFSGPLQVRIGTTDILLRRNEAAKITVCKRMKRSRLLGMPNTGKSTLFNRMTGGAARVGNWPGITVELLSGKILLGSDMVEIIDLPGIYDMHGFSDDEQVVRHFLHDNVPDLALVILNATQIERQMSLLLQLKQLNMNLVVLLNMADEAKKFGITHRHRRKCRELLGMPIFLLSAKYGTRLCRKPCRPSAKRCATPLPAWPSNCAASWSRTGISKRRWRAC